MSDEPTSQSSAGFHGLVLSWLQTDGRCPRAEAVESVEASGWDYTGNIEDGRDPTFTVEIVWLDAAAEAHCETVEGGALESLWNRVVAACGG